MCTVSFIPKADGYLLAMNRDESVARARGLPPELCEAGGGWVMRPREPSGGTWISVNSSGLALALLNWYQVGKRVERDPLSRGDLVSRLGGGGSSDAVSDSVRRSDLGATNPFRLLCFDPSAGTMEEWCWDLDRLARMSHDWGREQWASSGFDEPRARAERRRVFERRLLEPESSGLGWLRGLHSGHEPERGPYSHCMHRGDARTVSYTEIRVESGLVTMGYHDGPPCLGGEILQTSASLQIAGSNDGT